MTIKKLIEILEKRNPEDIVVCQKDGEGNGWSPLADVYFGLYFPDTTWSGEVISENDPEIDDANDGQRAVILCPTN